VPSYWLHQPRIDITTEAEEAVKVGGLKGLSIIEVITCNIAWVACEAYFSWVWGHPLRKICKNRCCEMLK